MLVLGLSHRSAPISALEQVSLRPDQIDDLRGRLVLGQHVREAVVVGTCNRLEVYAEAETFHGAVTEITTALAEVSGADLTGLRPHLYVHHDERAVSHTFHVACGLDSMALGEGQILGQLRGGLRAAQHGGEVGPQLNSLFQRALRVGKAAHSETGIDDVAVGLVEAGLLAGEEVVGPLPGRHVLVVGAGAMSSLAAATSTRLGAGTLTITNRTPHKSEHLAASYDADSVPFEELGGALVAADVVVTCTGASAQVISAEQVQQALAQRPDRPLVLIDLALPHDVDRDVLQIPGVTLVGLEELGLLLAGDGQVPAQVEAVRELVAEEVASFLADRRRQAVAPTVAALRSRAAAVVEAELERLRARMPDLDEATDRQVALTVHRVVEKLLHAPSVRVKELAGAGGSGDYADALRELFDLDPQTVAAVSTADDDAAYPPDATRGLADLADLADLGPGLPTTLAEAVRRQAAS
nr:glutamyl-tRNA reductase [Arsenicicoccus piscis]